MAKTEKELAALEFAKKLAAEEGIELDLSQANPDDGIVIDIPETPAEETGERVEANAPVDDKLVEKIRRRQKMAEENAQKRRNQPITLKEQKAAAIERGKEVMKRNAEMAERRKKLHEMIEKQQAENAKNNAKNMVGLLTVLLRELELNKRLEIICQKNGYTKDDLLKLKENNPSGWEKCLIARPRLDKELELLK